MTTMTFGGREDLRAGMRHSDRTPIVQRDEQREKAEADEPDEKAGSQLRRYVADHVLRHVGADGTVSTPLVSTPSTLSMPIRASDLTACSIASGLSGVTAICFTGTYMGVRHLRR